MRKIILTKLRPFLAISLILLFFTMSLGQENPALTAEYTMGNEINIDKIRMFALREAESSWGDVSMGPMIRVCDTRGNIIAYEIIFSLNGKEFPEKKAVYEKISRAKELIKLADEQKNKEFFSSPYKLSCHQNQHSQLCSHHIPIQALSGPLYIPRSFLPHPLTLNCHLIFLFFYGLKLPDDL